MKVLLTPTAFKTGLLATLLCLILYGSGIPFFHLMELKAFDLHFLYRGKIKAGDDIVIVAIDQKSIDDLGRWPWPRTRIAELVNRLNSYGAKVAAFDIVFSEPDKSSGIDTVRELKKRLKGRGSEIRSEIEAMEREVDNDGILASMLKTNSSVVLGYFFFTSEEEIRHLRQTPDSVFLVKEEEAGFMLRSIEQDVQPPDVLNAAGIEENIPLISEAGSAFGYFNIVPDSDGTVRWVPLVARYGEHYYPHISIEVVRKYIDSPPLILNAARYGVDSVQIGDLIVPTDERGRLLINYRGPQKTFPHYSFSDVLNGSIPEDAFRDKIVIVGATAIGIYDMRVTPFSGTFPGVEIHANVIDSILMGDFIHRPDWILIFDIASILFLGVSLSITISRIRALYAALFTIGLVGAYIVLNGYVFDLYRIWLTVVYPVITIVFVSGCVVTFQFMTEERKKREIKDAFSHYVSPSLVGEILVDPNKLVLGGEERRLTVLFSDIRGFTTISEGLKPQALVKLMNDFLTPMTEVILENGGTIDKYMGDAIMAFWGAPVWQEDHSEKACRTALIMLQRLAELRVEWEKAGVPRLDIGIGISSGAVTVGNMGSATRFNYTVMGDTVNLGSRLEGLNKEYSTHIIVPKYTYEDVKDEFILRQLDLIRVKGKHIPIKIYELMGGKSEEKLSEIAGIFEMGLDLYQKMEWEKAGEYFNEVLKLRPDDGPSKTFLTRMDIYKEAAPPPDWDGVFVMTKK